MNKFDIYSVITPCGQLMNTSSRLEKEEILRENIDNEPFKEVLRYMLDNMRISGISEKKFDKETRYGFYEEESGDWLIEDLLHYFDEHNTGTDGDIAYVQFLADRIANTYPNVYDDIYDFIRAVVTKKLRLGVDYTTANKIYGKDFIKKKEIMLGTSIEHCNIPEGEWFSISQKLNGTRCFYYNGQLYSRQGKVFTGLEHIVSDLAALSQALGKCVNDLVYDGELLLKDLSAGDGESFQISTGIANSKQEDKSMLRLVIFDVISKENFEEQSDSDTYKVRSQTLSNIKNEITEMGLENIDVVPIFYQGTDQKKIWEWLDYAERTDMEGLMLNLDVPYRFKRTKELVKIKKFYTMDLLVVRMDKGTGRNKDRLGKVYVDFKGNEVGVGSGFSDEQRDYFWKYPEEIVGKIIEVKYKEETKNKDGSESLQFPVFVCIRDDKDEVSFE